MQGQIFLFYEQTIDKLSIDKNADFESLERKQKNQQNLHYNQETLLSTFDNLFRLKVWDNLMSDDLLEQLYE